MPLTKETGPIPNFIVAGAARAGTTFLCTCLVSHPDVWMPQPFIPEPKVFTNPNLTPDQYQEAYRKIYDQRNEPILGEKTVNYLETPGVAQRLRELLPDVKLIFILREPVARAYSNWLWSRMNGHETLPFNQAVAKEDQRRFIKPPGLMTSPFDYLHRGQYDKLLEPYLRLFPKEQIGIFLYEELENRWQGVLENILNLIKAENGDRVWHLDWPGIVNSSEVGPPLQPQTRALLREKMKPSVDRLEKLITLDLSVWGY